MEFIKVKITEEMIKRAEERANEIPKSKNTFMPHERHVIGFLGEEMFNRVFPMAKQSKGSNVYNYDYLMANKRFEIKTKMCSSDPRPDYECSIYTYYEQKADVYLFCRIKKEFGSYPYGWVLGYITKRNFDDKKFLIKKGTKQPNGFTTRVDTWNVYIKDLNAIRPLFNASRNNNETT